MSEPDPGTTPAPPLRPPPRGSSQTPLTRRRLSPGRRSRRSIHARVGCSRQERGLGRYAGSPSDEVCRREQPQIDVATGCSSSRPSWRQHGRSSTISTLRAKRCSCSTYSPVGVRSAHQDDGRLSSGDVPDLFQYYDAGLVPWAANGLLADLEKLLPPVPGPRSCPAP